MPLSQTTAQDSSGAIMVDGRILVSPTSPSSTTVGITSATAVVFNASRKGLVLTNLSAGRISLAFGVAAVLNSGITLYPGGVYVMDEYTYNNSSVSAIASLAGSTLAIQEFN